MGVLSGNRSLRAGTTEISVTISMTVSDSLWYGCSKPAVRINLIHLLHSSRAAESLLGDVGPYMTRYVKPGRLYEVCAGCLQGSHESEDRDMLMRHPKISQRYIDETSQDVFLWHRCWQRL